ncbi:MAG TPA: hypothetical protein VF024_09850 [Solirubrobacteraceae bacterium]
MPALFHGYGAVDVSSCTALAVAHVLPRRPRRMALRIPHTWAAILPPAAFLATVAGLAMHPSLALAVVAVACVAVPALGALAIAAFARGGRPARALLVLPLLGLAALHVGLAGELAVLMLVMLSCVALGSLLAASAGVLELVVAARKPSRQTLVALATTAFALAQYALSSDGDLLSATAPVAVALLAVALAGRLRRRRAVATAAPVIWFVMLISNANHLPGRSRRPAAPRHRAHRAAPAPGGRRGAQPLARDGAGDDRSPRAAHPR